MHVLLTAFQPNWVVGTASFLASCVEFVEAFTIVLVVGLTINWRSSLLGALLATVTLAVLIAIFGVALFKIQYLDVLRLVIGLILVMFGLKWLKKALLRYSGRKALHDEEAIYEEEMAALKARGVIVPQKINAFGVITAYKSVLLEGLEVAFIVVTFGLTVSAKSGSASAAQSARADSLTSAIIGAVLAGVLVIVAGVVVRAPLSRVPENTLKFVVGIMLASFGTFWGGEGLGIIWPEVLHLGPDVMLLPIIAGYLLLAYVAVQVLRQTTKTGAGAAATAKSQH